VQEGRGLLEVELGLDESMSPWLRRLSSTSGDSWKVLPVSRNEILQLGARNIGGLEESTAAVISSSAGKCREQRAGGGMEHVLACCRWCWLFGV
jgi:hypothetical protein